ncbi:MAG: hypothetical protein A2V78_00785 [Betaproteobacteria bacterium RBG_16_64_18]|nr:MAG: hypothetical protein A2V78_00785 [Betaproteobacteria bacterium RBG_16_64_18]
MDTPEDIAREQWYSDVVDQISKEAIDQFTFDRMRSYYVNNRSLAVKVVAVLREAESLQATSPTAATVLFTTAIELGLKVALLKPVIYGLVHNESVADLISDLSVKHNGFDRFKPLLARVRAGYGGIDFNAFTIEGHKKTVWEEITVLQDARNAVVHRGDLVSTEIAELAKQVATMIIGNYFVSVLGGLGLKYAKGGGIENA